MYIFSRPSTFIKICCLNRNNGGAKPIHFFFHTFVRLTRKWFPYLHPSTFLSHIPTYFCQVSKGLLTPVIYFNSGGVKESTDKPEENEEEELAAAISQSAEEGMAWFNNFISSVFGEEVNETSTDSVEPLYNRTNTIKITS